MQWKNLGLKKRERTVRLSEANISNADHLLKEASLGGLKANSPLSDSIWLTDKANYNSEEIAQIPTFISARTGASHFQRFSDDELRAIASHPGSSESAWFDACAELNQRQENRQTQIRRQRRVKQIAVVAISILICCSAISALSIIPLFSHLGSGSQSVSSSVNNFETGSQTYVQTHAHWQNELLRERQSVQIAQKLYELGWNSSKAAKYFGVDEKRMTDLMEVRKRDPFNMEELHTMLFALGESASLPEEMNLQEKSNMVNYYSRAISIDPDNQRAYWRRGVAYEKLRNYDLAIGDVTRSLELKPDRDWLLEKRAYMYLKAKKVDLAMQDANELVAKFPQHNGHELRAYIWEAKNRMDNALADFSTSISKDPDASPDVYSGRAEIYERLGMYKEAIADLQSAQKVDPNYSGIEEAISRLRGLSKGKSHIQTWHEIVRTV